MKRIILITTAMALLASCSPIVSDLVTEEPPEGVIVVQYKATDRAAYIRKINVSGEERTVLVAEPSPDAALQFKSAIDLAVQGIEGQIDASAKGELATSIVDLAKRSQALQIQREAYYRLSEMLANGFIDQTDAKPLFESVLQATADIAKAELVRANTKDTEVKTDAVLKAAAISDPEVRSKALEAFKTLGIIVEPK